MPTTFINILPQDGNSVVTAIDFGSSTPKLSGAITLSEFSNLQYIKCVNNDVTQLSGYENLSNINQIIFNNNKLNSLNFTTLSAKTNLANLNYSFNRVSGVLPRLPVNIQTYACNNNTHSNSIPTLAPYSAMSMFYGFNNAFNSYTDTAIPSGTNGNFETFSAGVPIGWIATEAGLTSSLSAANSPFTNVFANNSKCWRIVDASSTGTAGFYQNFSTTQQYLNIAVEFDFAISGNSGTWGVQFDGAGAQLTGPVNSSAHFRINSPSGKFSIYNGVTNLVQEIATITPNTWYRVKAVLCTTDINTNAVEPFNGGGYQYGSITEFGGSTTTWNNVGLIDSSIGYSRILVRDRVTATNSDLFLDNFRISPAVSPTLEDFRVHNNLLNSAAVNNLLRAFVVAEKTTGVRIISLSGSGNAAPTGQGLTDKATLISRGWTVATN
jgi:hypothetical protein